MLSRRDAIGKELKALKDAAVRERLLGLPAFQEACVLLLFASFRSEVDTLALLPYCLKEGKTVILPVTDMAQNTLRLYEVRSMDELAPGCYGIPEPAVGEDRRREVKGIDLLLIPGVAFDLQGNRLGYGKGFYDRLLRSYLDALPRPQRSGNIIALAYEEQVVERIPSEAHDVRMDTIITDKRIISCHDE